MNSLSEKIVELQEKGFCILAEHFMPSLVEACSTAFQPVLSAYLESNADEPNRSIHRHFLPMPFDRPCFDAKFFFDQEILGIVKAVMGDRIVADQWGCDVPLYNSDYQNPHVDYQRPLFHEYPGMKLPTYMLVVSFGLVSISIENGAIEIAPGTHLLSREEAFKAIENNEIKMSPVPLKIGDVLIRHPWTLHRGTPNRTHVPRPLLSIRYVRHWYADNSREVNTIPNSVWTSLNLAQQDMMRFPVIKIPG